MFAKEGLQHLSNTLGSLVVPAIREGVSHSASVMPNRAVLKWCQTAWRAFAQTVTLLPLTTTDGVSHAHCVEGYGTALRMGSCVLNLIWATQVQPQTDLHTHMERHITRRGREGTTEINHAVNVEMMAIGVL